MSILTAEEAKAVFKTIAPYNGEEDLTKAASDLEDIFSMYAHDRKNADAAIKQAEADQEKQAAAIQKDLAVETSITKLTEETATAYVNPAPGAKLKKKMVVVEENTEEWAVAVIAEFVKNWQSVRKHVRVGTWAKLSIGQMATALGKHATESSNHKLGILKLEEDIK